MRSSTGPILVILGLASTVVLVLLFLQSIGLRDDLDATREEVASLRSGETSTMPADELRAALDDVSARLDELESSAGIGGGTTDPEQPAGGGDEADIADRLDEILERIEALDARVDEVCDNVPVC
jgi:hypothetical protein